MRKVIIAIGFTILIFALIFTNKPKKEIKIYEGDVCMINELVLVGKVAYDPVFYETQEEKLGKIAVLVTTLKGNRTEFEIFECEGKAEEIERFKKTDSVIVYGKLKNDNNRLKIVITQIKGGNYEYYKMGN